MSNVRTKRLSPADRELAKKMFVMMATVFDERCEPLSDGYVDRLLSRTDFWAIAALIGDEVVGGITAHSLAMTRAESSEILIYDLAVRRDFHRNGIGRRLITALRTNAASIGIHTTCVAADNHDVHALGFYRALGGIASPVTFFVFSNDE